VLEVRHPAEDRAQSRIAGTNTGSASPTGYSLTESTQLTSVNHQTADAVTGIYASSGYSTEEYSLLQTETPSGGGSLTVTESGLILSYRRRGKA
jgi:hypothetical protein